MEIVRETLDLPPDGYHHRRRACRKSIWAIWDQLTDDEARALDPAYFDRRGADKWNVPALGGENYAQVAARLTDWVREPEGRHLRGQPWRRHPHPARAVRGPGWQRDEALDEPQGVVFRVRGNAVEHAAGRRRHGFQSGFHGLNNPPCRTTRFGHLFRVTTFGESHGPAIGCVVDGCPPGIALTEADIQA